MPEFTPAYLATGRELNTPYENLLGLKSSSSNVEELADRMAYIHNLAQDNLIHSQEISLRSYSKKSKHREFEIGQLVLYRTHFLSNAAAGFTKKLAPRFEGPYEIIEKISNS